MEWNWKEFPPLYGDIHDWWRFDRKKLATIASSEVILNYCAIKEDDEYNYFLLGWVTMTILNPIMYVIRDQMTPGGWGDLQNIGLYNKYDKGAVQKETVETFIIAHAILNLIRVVAPAIDKQDTFSISSTPNSVGIAVSF